MPSAFSNGVSVRAVVSFDEQTSWASVPDYYHYIAQYRDPASGGPLFGIQYLVSNLRSIVYTRNGGGGKDGSTLSVPITTIETQLGLGAGGLVGTPIVVLSSWSRATTNLSLYVNGQFMGELTDATLANELYLTVDEYFTVGNQRHQGSSRAGVIDDVKVWDGPLTAAEAMADYRKIVPFQGTLITVP